MDWVSWGFIILNNRALPLRTKGRLYSCLRSDVLHDSQNCPVKEDNVRWVCHVRPKDMNFAVELRNNIECHEGMFTG